MPSAVGRVQLKQYFFGALFRYLMMRTQFHFVNHKSHMTCSEVEPSLLTALAYALPVMGQEG
jgi:hypothetical protein